MITIEGELYSSKNSRQILISKTTGKPFVSKSKIAKEDEKNLITKLTNQKQEFLKELEGHTFPVVIVFKIYRKTHRKFDYINIIQNLCDCMVQAGILEDDCADVIIPAFEPYEVDKERPRVEITVAQFVKENKQ